MSKFKKIVLALVAASMLLFAGCPAEGEYIPEIPDEVVDGDVTIDTDKPPVDSANPGELLAFAYSYGSFNEGYWDYSITRMEDDFGNEHIYFRAEGMNGVDLNVYAEIEQSTLDDVAAIIEEHNIFSWNGFSGNDEDVLDGYSFTLAADYKNGLLTAGGYAETPENYNEGHTALSEYFWTLAEGMEAPAIESKEDIYSINVNFHEGFAVNVNYNVGDTEKAHASYRHGDEWENYTRDEIGADEFDSYVDYLLALYTEYKDEPQDIGADPGAYINISGVNSEISYDATIDQTRYADVYSECLTKSLEIVGKAPDFRQSEEFETETYKVGFIYTEFYFYDKNGLGTVVINMPEQSVTVNGDAYTVDRQTMLDFYARISGNLFIDFPFIDAGENELHGGYLEDGQTAQGVFDSLVNDGNVWIFGRNHKQDAFYLYGGKDAATDEWSAAVELVQGVIDKSEKA